jgi:ligand-binding sensor domain-containing protein
MQNGEFSIINESNGLGHNSCWDISQDIDGNMWFASYGGVSVSLMGKVSPFYY